MEINMSDVFSVFEKAGHTIGKTVFKYIPSTLSSEKQFADAYAACIAILIIADRKIEVEETKAAISFIKRSAVLTRIDCVSYTLDFYAAFIARFQPLIQNEPMLLVEIAKVIEDHIKPVDKTYKSLLIQLIMDLTSGNPNQQELLARAELLSVLG